MAFLTLPAVRLASQVGKFGEKIEINRLEVKAALALAAFSQSFRYIGAERGVVVEREQMVGDVIPFDIHGAKPIRLSGFGVESPRMQNQVARFIAIDYLTCRSLQHNFAKLSKNGHERIH